MAIQTNAQEMNKVPTVKLNNGMEMPQLGVGTFLVKDDAAERVCHAIKVGFRLFDTAQGYGNEKEVGEGIRRSGIDRRELFITTKVNTTEMRGGTVRQSLDKSLADLGTDYIDLVLIHWPVKGHIKETWQILEEYVDKGKIRSIGMSNFNPHHLDELLEYARIRPVVNQIEIEPYMTQHDVVGYTFRKGVQVEAPDLSFRVGRNEFSVDVLFFPLRFAGNNAAGRAGTADFVQLVPVKYDVRPQ